MITKEMVNVEMKTGLNAVCAWCEHWHNAKDRNGEIKSCGMVGCGGPAVGKAFPLYKGPMNGQLNKFCFICGGEVDAVVEIQSKMIGVCDKSIRVNRPNTCIDILREVLNKNNITVTETAIPVIGK